MTVRMTITRKPHVTACRLDGGVVHITIDGYETVSTRDRVTTRIAHAYLYNDGFASGTIDSFDGEGREIRSKHLDESEVTNLIRQFDLWSHASVA